MLHVLTITLLALQQQGAAPMTDATKSYEALSVRYTGGEYKDEEFKYRLLKPAKIEEGKKYPLVVFLDGAGERGDDNKCNCNISPR